MRITTMAVIVAALMPVGPLAAQSASEENSAKQERLCPVDGEWGTPESERLRADISAIEKLMTEWAAAVVEADIETIVSLVTEDCEFWTHGADPLVGRQDLAEAFAPFLEQYRMEQRYECQELIVATDWAFMRGTELNHLTPRDGGETIVRRQRAFSVLRRSADGRWLFARGMTNLPPDAEAGEQ